MRYHLFLLGLLRGVGCGGVRVVGLKECKLEQCIPRT